MANREELEAMGIRNNNNLNNNDIITNSTAKVIRAIGFIQIIAGIITLFVMLGNQFYVGLTIFITAFVTGILEIGFAEIIQKLQNIEDNTRK